MLLANNNNNNASFSSFLQDVMVPVACPTGRFQRRAIIQNTPHKIKPTSMDRSRIQSEIIDSVFDISWIIYDYCSMWIGEKEITLKSINSTKV